jgi:hypothetical protein
MPYYLDIYDPDDPSGEPTEVKGPIAKPETASDVALGLQAQGKRVRIREEPFRREPQAGE